MLLPHVELSSLQMLAAVSIVITCFINPENTGNLCRWDQSYLFTYLFLLLFCHLLSWFSGKALDIFLSTNMTLGSTLVPMAQCCC